MAAVAIASPAEKRQANCNPDGGQCPWAGFLHSCCPDTVPGSQGGPQCCQACAVSDL